MERPETYEDAQNFLKLYNSMTKNDLALSACIDRRTLQRWRIHCEKIVYNVPEGHTLKGTSTLIGADGSQKLQWVKTSKDLDRQKEVLDAFAEGLKDDIPRAIPNFAKPQTVKDLLATYILTDAHIGMRSPEWNLEIAEKTVTNWIDETIKQAPNADTGLLCFQGDTMHWDSLSPVTPAHKHVLDADCSAREMTRCVIRLVRYAVSRLLYKHKNVHIIFVIGNHDEYGATIHSEWLDMFYESEPRVTVDRSESVYHCYTWGDTSLFFHHGHKRKISDISNVFAGMYRKEYGNSKYSYGHVGHYHHSARTENQLMQVEIHPTLSGKVDYAVNGGWLSQRGANTIIYHKQYGEVGRITIRPEQLQ